MDKKSVIIIGGGAAGFFCAANLDERLFRVKILEQNSDVLQKVKISGGGRCNVTHACFDPAELTGFYPRGQKELRSVFHKFQPGDTMEWFSTRGVELKVEADNRVFPVSDSSQSIINALVNAVTEKGFEICTRSVVTAIIPQGTQYLVKTADETFEADDLIYCTGSSPKSLKMIAGLGHQIVEPVPSLFTFNIKNDLLKDLPGTSFPNAELSIPALKTEESGPLLITHWGLSGPAVLKISAWKARELAALQYRTELVVNFAGIPRSDAEDMLMDYKQDHPKKTVGAAKIFEVTSRFWQQLLKVQQINPEKQMANLSATEIQMIVNSLCQNKMQITGKSTFKDEFVTAGGVELKEINFKNMSSKLLPNVYVAGEVLNIDAVTGGFNFQACWSEAWLIAQDLNEKTDVW